MTERLTAGQRIAVYVAALVVLPSLAYGLGFSHSVQQDCGGDGNADGCDVPAIAGLVWGVIGFAGTIWVIAVVELARASSRRRP